VTDREPARFYTVARRIPTLIGRLVGGAPIPYGPYTIGQVVAFLGTAFLLWQTTGIWARFGGLMNLVFGVAAVAAATWGAGKLPRTGRNPLSWVLDMVLLLLRSPGGVLDRRPLRAPRGQVVTYRLVVPAAPAVSAGVSHVVPVEQVKPVEVEVPGVAPLSGVGRLLAAAIASKEASA
jgi:hypothetical protein